MSPARNPTARRLEPPAPASRRSRTGREQDGAAKKPSARVRQALSSKERILKVAIAEFAAKGYDGARVDEIVRRCKVSKNLVYYYFGNKERLFIAALESAYAAMRDRQAALSFAGLGPAEGMRSLIGETFRALAETPEFIGLLNSENLHKARHLKKSSLIRKMYPPLVESIRELLELGRKTGEFRADADPVDLYMSISGMGYHALSNRFTLSVLFDRDLASPAQMELRLRHTVDVIMGYLAAPRQGLSPRSAPRGRR